MNIRDIAQAKTEKRVIELAEGVSAEVYLRPMPFYLFWDGKDENGNELSGDQLIARRIAHCIVDEEDQPIFTYEQIMGTDPEYKVHPRVTIELGNLIAEENSVGKFLKEGLSKKKSSGAN